LFFLKHEEDSGFYSLNYLHEGEQKTWIFIDQNSSSKYIDYISRKFPDQKCKLFYRHKDLLIHPQDYVKNEINFEIVIFKFKSKSRVFINS
jgi:hypothetical protein